MQPMGPPSGEVVFAPRFAGAELATRAPEDRHRVMQEWLLGFRSQNTRDAYRRDIEAYFAWLDEFRDQLGVDVWSVGRFHLNAYREFLLNGEHRTRYHGTRSYSDATVGRKQTVISSFYAYCVDELPHLVPTNPMAKVPRVAPPDDSTTKALDIDEARRLLDAARRSGPTTQALIGLLLTTGMRISEAVKVDTGDLDIEDGQRIVWVRRKGGKRAKLVLPIETARAVDRCRRGRRGPLFVGSTNQRLKRQQVDRVLARLVKDAEIVDAVGRPKTLTPHMLRATAATMALDAGRDLVDVQEMLGHSDPKTTRRYIKNRDQLKNSAVHTVAHLLGADVDPGDET